MVFKTDYRIMQVKTIAVCSAILSTFIKLPVVIKTLFCLFLVDVLHMFYFRKQHGDPVLHLYGSPIPVVEESKFILFDRKLSFIPHIKYLKAKCSKALNLLKVPSHTSWGADRTTLLRLYRSLVRSKLDYGCIIYGSARKSYLQMLDPIHNHGLRLALGAFRTSPVASLYVGADGQSLYSRREKLSLQYAIRLSANPSNPAHEVTFPPINSL